MPTPAPPATFTYRGTTATGQPVAGTVDAVDESHARELLAAMQVQPTEVGTEPRRPRARTIRGTEFMAFNAQLAQLTAAGLPVERGLRLIADDMRSGRVAAAVRQVASDLDAGRSLPEALQANAGQFPPLYGRLVAAGVTAGNLPAMLLNLGRHLELVNRLRAAVWRAAAYPLMVLCSLVFVLAVLGLFVMPMFTSIFSDFHTELPAVTKFVIWAGGWAPAAGAAMLAVIIVGPLMWRLMMLSPAGRRAAEAIVLPIPLVGPVVRRNLVSRWCDALRLGVQAGLDLPKAIDLASDAVASPGLARDGQLLTTELSSGRGIDESVRTRLLPPTVTAAIAVATSQGSLPEALEMLSQLLQQQAELRLALLPAVLAPALLAVVGVVIGVVILGLFAPMISLIGAVSGHWN